MTDKIDIDAFEEFVEQLSTAGHRTAIILGVAKLDQQLYFLLSKILLPKNKKHDNLFGSNCPLSSFSAKINICYRLGLIDYDFKQALHLFRKIRNDFAHEIYISLDKPPQRDRVREILKYVKNTELFNNTKDVYGIYFKDFSSLITKFSIALILYAMRLEAIIIKTTKICSVKSPSIIPGKYQKSRKENNKK